MNAVILPLSPFVKEERCLTQYFSVMAVTIFCLVSNISVWFFNAVGEQKETLRPCRAVAEAISDLQILHTLNAVTCLTRRGGTALPRDGDSRVVPGSEAAMDFSQGRRQRQVWRVQSNPASEGNKTLAATSPSFLSKSLLMH